MGNNRISHHFQTDWLEAGERATPVEQPNQEGENALNEDNLRAEDTMSETDMRGRRRRRDDETSEVVSPSKGFRRGGRSLRC